MIMFITILCVCLIEIDKVSRFGVCIAVIIIKTQWPQINNIDNEIETVKYNVLIVLITIGSFNETKNYSKNLHWLKTHMFLFWNAYEE